MVPSLVPHVARRARWTPLVRQDHPLSAHDERAGSARPQGRADANVGVSRVPDDRLDQLTALFNPKKRVPATVEFADMAAGRSDAKSLVDVAAYRNADALLHVVRAFHDPSVPHPQST